MSTNPLFRASNSPTQTTKPTKAVNQTGVSIKKTHNTFDNSYFNFKTQRFGLYEPFFWKVCTAGDNEPLSSSHNVRSLPFASPILSPLKLNKDYFQVPMYAIQPNTWDYIFKNPNQGDDVPLDAQNLFRLFIADESSGNVDYVPFFVPLLRYVLSCEVPNELCVWSMLICEKFLSSGSLLFQMGYKTNVFIGNMPFDLFFDKYISNIRLTIELTIDSQPFEFTTDSENVLVPNVDHFTMLSLMRSYSDYIYYFETVANASDFSWMSGLSISNIPSFAGVESLDMYRGVNCVRMDTIIAYQLACAQYYVNPRVDFLYNAQLYRDNWLSLLRSVGSILYGDINVATFDFNGIPVFFDYFSSHYYDQFLEVLFGAFGSAIDESADEAIGVMRRCYSIFEYLFGFREQLKFGDYFSDSRTQALGYGEEGSDVVTVLDGGVTVTDISQKLVLNRFRSAVAHLDNTSEDYLKNIFGEDLPPDYHFPKFIVHSEFGVNGEEISNTTSDAQGNYVTNLKSGNDTAEFNINISVNSILIGISYFSMPIVYSQVKERTYMHEDRYDMFNPMLQYFGDQEIYCREKSDLLPVPDNPYGYVSRNGEYKQRVSQVSGAFLTSLRSWLFVGDPLYGDSVELLPIPYQNSVSIRHHDFDFNRFLKAVPGLSLGTGFHFIMQYNNKNVDNRPMEVNPLPLYPNGSL